ncbi:nitroreductase family protein [Clostridium sp. 19966]|uniref:nitroreductase family protein n=1 Tax=Clostridium sp. 19966 TaxID=2768166 RepID=UPI0028DD6F44|nr:nitroreductase family protein [Clostridium sp. 19966]MDT8717992.1 nitroreductase family protein [Clostridium sp. 19966]
MSKDLYEVIKERRTIYGLSKEITVSDERIKEVVEFAVNNTPSAFNSQSSRAVVLLGKEHDALWEIAKDALRKIVPAEAFAQTEDKINSFKSGYGTILFFEDESVVKGLQEQFALYKDNFPVWSEQSSGMLQINVWNALSAEGLGASLQHYNPLIDDEVKAKWNIPANWKLRGEMPFGKATSPAGEKAFLPIDQRVKIFK